MAKTQTTTQTATQTHHPPLQNLNLKMRNIAKQKQKYLPKGEFDIYTNMINERCAYAQNEIKTLKKKQISIDNKITATLIAVIVTESTILTSLILGAL